MTDTEGKDSWLQRQKEMLESAEAELTEAHSVFDAIGVAYLAQDGKRGKRRMSIKERLVELWRLDSSIAGLKMQAALNRAGPMKPVDPNLTPELVRSGAKYVRPAVMAEVDAISSTLQPIIDQMMEAHAAGKTVIIMSDGKEVNRIPPGPIMSLLANRGHQAE